MSGTLALSGLGLSLLANPIVHAVVGIALGTYLGLKSLAIYLERTGQ
ncbi:MAG: hypothetical protein ABEJ31_13380 [Haloarculaceae archaeon]